MKVKFLKNGKLFVVFTTHTQQILFTNKKQENVSYNHDEVYNAHSEKFENMNCFQKYKSYTNTNAVPAFCRNLQTVS